MRLLLLCLSSVAMAAPPVVRTAGSLRFDGVPEVPRAVADRARPYSSVRAASFVDWRSDGTMLVATRFGETNQLHEVAAPGGDRRQLTFFAEPVTEAAYTSDGLVYRIDQGGNEFYQYARLDKGVSTLLTDGKSRNEGLLAGPGGRFAFSSTRRNGTDHDIYVLEPDGKNRLLVEEKGAWQPLAWSVDGKKLVVAHEVSIVESTVHVVDVEHGTQTQLLARPKPVAYGDAAFDARGRLWLISDDGGEFRDLRLLGDDGKLATPERPGERRHDVEAVTVSPDGKRLAFSVNSGGESIVYVGATEAPRDVKRIELPRGVLAGKLRFDARSERLGLTWSSAHGHDAWAVDSDGRATRWTFSETGGLDAAAFVEPSFIEWKSFDGKKISGWLYRPRGTAKVPVVINIHGGPESQSTVAFNPPVQLWVAQLGVAVILPNVRGSAGFGRGFLQLDNGAKRLDSVRDIGALLDFIGGRADLDGKRVAVYGGSYGGFMVLASLVAYSARLVGGIDIVGISNFVTFLERTESYRRDLRRVEYGDERDPKMRAALVEASPLTHAARIGKPLFVVQGQNDPRVPVGEAEQIVHTLRDQGGDVWYLLAADEGHGFQKRKNRDALIEATLLFFEKLLK